MKARYALAALLVVAATALVAVLVLRDSEASAQSFRGSTPPPGITLPDFELRNYSGEAIRSRDLQGKIILVTFLETQCREACPIIASHIGAGLDLLSSEQRRQLVPLAISTHPEDDTPANFRAFLRHHRVEGRLRYLIGSEAELRPVWTPSQSSPPSTAAMRTCTRHLSASTTETGCGSPHCTLGPI